MENNLSTHENYDKIVKSSISDVDTMLIRVIPNLSILLKENKQIARGILHCNTPEETKMNLKLIYERNNERIKQLLGI